MQIDLAGNIWLEDSGPSIRNRTNKWWVIDSTGVLVTKVLVPRRILPGSPVFSIGGSEIGADYILQQGSNADGAPTVRLHTVRKNRS